MHLAIGRARKISMHILSNALSGSTTTQEIYSNAETPIMLIL